MKDMRPTTGRVLLALFNILGNINGLSFLDLFSGSGRIAKEASQRGAFPVFAVESDKKRHLDIVQSVPKEVKCLCIDVRRALSKFVRNGTTFDIIFADPPYDLGWGDELPKLMEVNSAVLASDGVFIFEHSETEGICAFDPSVWTVEDRNYGGTVLTFCRRRSNL